jgi:hypothetical protein
MLIRDGTVQHFEPLAAVPELPVPFDLQLAVHRATLSGTISEQRWADMRRQQLRMLRMTVMGASTTSGCGSAELLRAARCASDAELSRYCDFSRSWVRHMHDALQVELATRPTHHVWVNTFPRNAQAASYFARCTGRFVGSTTRIIVLEVAQVGFPTLKTDIVTLVDSLRRHAPAAAIVLLTWVSKDVLFPPGTKVQATTAKLSNIIDAALSLGVDVLRVDRIALAIVAHRDLVSGDRSGFASSGRGWCTKSTKLQEPLPASFRMQITSDPNSSRPEPIREVATSFLFAGRGRDYVHPTPEGHALIGRLVAQYVANRLGLSGELPTDSDAVSYLLGPGQPFNQSSTLAARPHLVQNDTSAMLWEQCFGAEELPVHGGQPPWKLTNEGGAKGVRKLGLISRRVGEVLTLGPIGEGLQHEWRSRLAAAPQAARVGHLLIAIELGYLLAPRPSFGALQLSCVGCKCQRLLNALAKSITPFPGIDTNAQISTNEHYRAPEFNATITATTVFAARLDLSTRSPMQCMLHIRHAPAGSGLSEKRRFAECNHANRTAPAYFCRPSNESRVRVDSLNAWGPTSAAGSILLARS